MRVVVIGSTGHIGTYLVPRLIAAGHEVIAVSRSRREPYAQHGAWKFATRLQIDRAEQEDRGTFGESIRALRADVVIDLICFTPESALQLVESLRSQIQHFLHCGTIWVHGPSVQVADDRGYTAQAIRRLRYKKGRNRRVSAAGSPSRRIPSHAVTSRAHRRTWMGTVESCRPFQSRGFRAPGSRRRSDSAKPRARNGAPRSCR